VSQGCALPPTSAQVSKDVQSILGISGAEVFRSSINRANLFWEVLHKAPSADEEFAQLSRYILKHYPRAADQGIVYCLTR
jgi:superfamily II DNA helicase RecQ